MQAPGAFISKDVTFKNRPELALLLKSFAGYAVIGLGGGPSTSITGGSNTHLLSGVTYTMTVTIDTVHVQAVSFTPVFVAPVYFSYDNLMAAINADLGGFGVAAMNTGSFVITSNKLGIIGDNSSVVVLDSGAFPLLAALSDFQYKTEYVGSDLYGRWNELDGVMQSSILSVMGTFLAGAPANTNVLWTQGFDRILLNPAGPAVGYSTPHGLTMTTVYQLKITVDGVGPTELFIRLTPAPNQSQSPTTIGQLVDDVIAAELVRLGVRATVAFTSGTPGKITFTSNSYGGASVVVLAAGAANDLLAALAVPFTVSTVDTAGYHDALFFPPIVGATPLVGPITAPSAPLTFFLTINGVGPLLFSVPNAAGFATFGALVAAIAPVVAPVGVAITLASTIRFTTSTTGDGSTMLITDGGAFPLFSVALGGPNFFVGFGTPVPGVTADDTGVSGTTDLVFPKTYNGVVYSAWLDVLNTSAVGGRNPNFPGQYLVGPTGMGPLFTSGTVALVTNPLKPLALGGPLSGPNPNPGVYYDSEAGAWKFWATDVITVAPPGFV